MFTKPFVVKCLIQPDNNFLDGISIIQIKDCPNTIQFQLNPDIELKTIELIDKDKSISLSFTEKPVPETAMFKTARNWEVLIPESIDTSHFVTIKFSYEGKVIKSNWELSKIDSNFIELASYGLWYPTIIGLERITFDLYIEAPKDWTFIANGILIGKSNKKNHLFWHWKNEIPDYDITLIGVPSDLAYTNQDSIFWGLNDIVVNHLEYEEVLLELKKEMEGWFGSRSSNQNFNYVFTPRESGGQYSRNNLISTIKELPKDEKMFPKVLQSMLHEVSHSWWNKTSISTYDNWIDEALAEYTSTYLVSSRYGGDEWIENRASQVKSTLMKAGKLPAIRDVIRSHKDAYVLYYYRGFLLFRELHNQMGSELFENLIHIIAAKSTKANKLTTEMFIEIVNEVSKSKDREYEKLINLWLDYSGEGIPSN